MRTKWFSLMAGLFICNVAMADYFVQIPNVDVTVGDDLAELFTADLESCEKACLADKECVAYNYINNVCWKKGKIVNLVPCNIDTCMTGLRVFRAEEPSKE